MRRIIFHLNKDQTHFKLNKIGLNEIEPISNSIDLDPFPSYTFPTGLMSNLTPFNTKV